MAKVYNFVYSLNVEMDNSITKIQGLLSAINPEYIPGLYSFSICFTILDIEDGEHILDVKFKDPDNNEIAGIKGGKLSYKKDVNSNLPDEHLGINVVADLQNVNFKKSGLYSTEVILDGLSIGNYPIFAKGKNE